MHPVLVGVLVGFVVTQIAVFSTTLYLHRELTHKAVTFHPAINEIFRFAVWVTSAGATIPFL